ncbi:protein CHUP1, chloroplastic [Corylus avellana]|uniref:protein CHUP1, chloroplastic n=1 Tax=Corylus avellana TaxID=13451 RepID=UPI001E1F68B5|nr:protein CHUP1, chloroplastic [Corylus avellana]XP_059434546.1 protein CHUP1, chloroplastic [Corylus avellana]
MMKQGTTPPPPPPPATATTRRNECKPSDMSQSTTPSRLRASPKATTTKSTPDAKTNRVSTARAASKSAPSPARRHLVVNKPKSGEEVVVGRTGNSRQVVEQFARPRQRRPSDPSCRRNENEDDPDGKCKDLLQCENLIQNLQSEVLALKAELDKSQSLNVELQSQNKKLTHDLAASEAKIAAFSCRDHQREEYQNPKFRDIQKLIASKLEFSTVKKEPMNEASAIQTPSPLVAIRSIPKSVDVERKAPPCSSAPPPPPPPPPPALPRPTARVATTQKAPALVESYRSLTRQEGRRGSSGSGNNNKPAAISVHTSIVGEIQNRSAHLLAIKVDIETKGDFINSLIQKVLAAAYTDIEDVLKFVDWLDHELSSLADERSVLKHFKWPERKADAMREAAIEYRELKLLESEISSYQDDTNIPCGAALKKIASLLDKSERSIQRLIKLRNSVMRSYQDYKIPTDWMLDSGIASKIKHASMNLAKMYIKRVSLELDSIRNLDRESSQESLLLQGVQFAYRAHQFAGGLDPETLCAFEEIRQQVPGHFGGSRAVLAGIKSS